jgi:hypothetical protein
MSGPAVVGNPQPHAAPCVVPDCGALVPNGRRMCKPCWLEVPLPLRERVWSAFRASQESPTNAAADQAAYSKAYAAAVDSVTQA